MGEVPLQVLTRPVELETPQLAPEQHFRYYRGTSLIRNTPLLGTYSRTYLGSFGGPRGMGDSYERGTPVFVGVSRSYGAAPPPRTTPGLYPVSDE